MSQSEPTNVTPAPVPPVEVTAAPGPSFEPALASVEAAALPPVSAAAARQQSRSRAGLVLLLAATAALLLFCCLPLTGFVLWGHPFAVAANDDPGKPPPSGPAPTLPAKPPELVTIVDRNPLPLFQMAIENPALQLDVLSFLRKVFPEPDGRNLTPAMKETYWTALAEAACQRYQRDHPEGAMRPDGKEDEPDADLLQFHLDDIHARPYDDLAEFWRQAEAQVDPASIRPIRPQDKPLAGPGMVLELRGNTWHKAGRQLILDTVIANIERELQKAPDARTGRNEQVVHFRRVCLGRVEANAARKPPHVSTEFTLFIVWAE
jgi:hypothetical protein